MDKTFSATGVSVVTDSIALILLVFTLINSHGKRKIASRDWLILRAMFYVIMILCVADPFTFYLNKVSFAGAYVVDLILNSILFWGISTFAGLWAQFVYLRAYGEEHYLSHRHILIYISLLSVAMDLLIFANLFYPVIFRIDSETLEYQRVLPGFIAIYAGCYAYMGAGVFVSDRKKTKRWQYLLGTAIFFVLPVSCAGIIQFFFEGLSLVQIGAAISLITAYFYIQDERSFLDPLSGVFNHLYMNQFLRKNLSEGREQLGGIMIDIDRFKSINDRFGHLEGDKAISETGELLRSATQWNEICFRFAGDEFCVLTTGHSEEEVKELIARLDKTLQEYNAKKEKPYALSFSMGYTMGVKGDTVDSFISRMDQEMYKVKKARKQEEADPR